MWPSNKKIKHLHLIIRATTYKEINLPESAESMSKLNTSLAGLIEDIGMKAVMLPRAVYVGAEGNEGYTGNAGLETSHVAYHVWDKQNLIQFDLYTCGSLDEDKIFTCLKWIEYIVGTLSNVVVLLLDRASRVEILYEGTFLDRTLENIAEVVGFSIT